MIPYPSITQSYKVSNYKVQANLYFLFHIIICINFNKQLNTIVICKEHYSERSFSLNLIILKNQKATTCPLLNLHSARSSNTFSIQIWIIFK